MLNTNSGSIATKASTEEGGERPKKKFKNVDLEKDGMNIKKVKENESDEADFNMAEKNKEEINEHAKEAAEDEESPKKNGYDAEIVTKECNKPRKDRKIKNGTEKKDNTSQYGEKTLEFAETAVKREIKQLEDSAAEVCPKKAKYEKADMLIKEGKSM